MDVMHVAQLIGVGASFLFMMFRLGDTFTWREAYLMAQQRIGEQNAELIRLRAQLQSQPGVILQDGASYRRAPLVDYTAVAAALAKRSADGNREGRDEAAGMNDHEAPQPEADEHQPEPQHIDEDHAGEPAGGDQQRLRD